jgi:uncharacterized protein (DUF2147 family)
MKFIALVVSIGLGVIGLAAAAGAAPEASAIGFWLNQDQGWVVETAPCASGLCGHLVGFRKTQYDGYVARDAQNPDKTKRNTPLCGLMLLGGFTPSKEAAAKWENGWVYDPDSGSTYSGVAELVDRDTVKLRGYVLLPLFGRTLTLIRETGTVTRCSVPPAMASAD